MYFDALTFVTLCGEFLPVNLVFLGRGHRERPACTNPIEILPLGTEILAQNCYFLVFLAYINGLMRGSNPADDIVS